MILGADAVRPNNFAIKTKSIKFIAATDNFVNIGTASLEIEATTENNEIADLQNFATKLIFARQQSYWVILYCSHLNHQSSSIFNSHWNSLKSTDKQFYFVWYIIWRFHLPANEREIYFVNISVSRCEREAKYVIPVKSWNSIREWCWSSVMINIDLWHIPHFLYSTW